MATPTGPEFGFAIPLDTTSVICLGLGVVIVALHSMKKFEESTVENPRITSFHSCCRDISQPGRNILAP